jgi:hypothetical protein
MDALLQTLLGGLLALGGALVGPFLQRKHDRWLAQREDQHLLREKAQELFDEIDRMVSQSAASCTSALVRMKDEGAQIVPVPQLGRIRTICAIYFPAVLPHIAMFESDHREYLMKVREIMEEALKQGDEGVETLKGLPILMTVQYQQLATKLASDMRDHLHQAVPKLAHLT